ncbi:hypothetical protein TRVL_03171 [Trypanosoma vivax]|nr:hypothetical protein TRVL_03171 [Trypanosoma vivax]
MGIYFMGPPRRNGGIHTMRPIIAVTRDAECCWCSGTEPEITTTDQFTQRFVAAPTSRGCSTNSVTSMQSATCLSPTPFLCHGDHRTDEGGPFSDGAESTQHRFLSFCRASSRRVSHISVDSVTMRIDYIHDSVSSATTPPARNDLRSLYEKHHLSVTTKPSSTPRTSPTVSRGSVLQFSGYEKLYWKEVDARREVLSNEERQWKRLRGEEVTDYLITQHNIRHSRVFRQVRFSSVNKVLKLEQQRLREEMEARAQTHENDHQKFMKSLSAYHLPRLSFPSVGATGRQFRPTTVDCHVAHNIAVEKRIFDKSGCREIYFPGIV